MGSPFFFLFDSRFSNFAPCVADPADISAKDGPPPDENSSRRHQEQRASHGLQSPRGSLSADPGTDEKLKISDQIRFYF